MKMITVFRRHHVGWEFPKIRGTFLGGPHNKDYNILGSILGPPYFGKLPGVVLGAQRGFRVQGLGFYSPQFESSP